MDYGRDNYAGVTWANVPAADGRRLFMGWMSNWDYANVAPTATWRSAMTLPRELTLVRENGQYLVVSKPAPELETLRAETYSFDPVAVQSSIDLTDKIGFAPTLSEVILELEVAEGTQTKVGIELSNPSGEAYRIGYDAAVNQYFSDRTEAGKNGFSDKFARALHTAPRLIEGQTVQMHLFFDVASAELFADGGATVMTEIFFPGEDFSEIRLFTEGGPVQLRSARVFNLRSIW